MDYLYILPVLLFSIVIHELAHGWVALRLGDPTARDLGRLTLNPIPHLDPVGSFIVPLASLIISGRVFIAWAKPVPVNPANFSNARRDDILVSIAGPVSNILLSTACTVAFIFTSTLAGAGIEGTLVDGLLTYLLQMFYGGIALNLVLALFNMLPIPPLDGSHVVASLLPDRLSARYRSVGFFGIFLVLAVMQYPPFREAFNNTLWGMMYPFDWVINIFL